MAGIGQKMGGKITRISVACPDDIDGIVDRIRQIILIGQVQTITLKNGEPIVYERLVQPGEEIKPQESTEGFAELTPFEVVRNVPMEEFRIEEYVTTKPAPHQTLVWSFIHLHLQDWIVTHILLGQETNFWKWLGMPRRGRGLQTTHFLNARVEEDKQVPENIYILCGARTRHATIAEIGCSLKCSAG